MSINKNIGVYMIKSPTNKIYIGQSRNLKKRITSYKNMNLRNKKQSGIWNSLIKHGSLNHTYEILELCKLEDLNIRERYYQEFYNSVRDGLNCVYVSTDEKPSIFSDETKKKMSKAMKKYYETNKHPSLGMNHTADSIEKMRISATGRVFSKEVNLSKGRKGSISQMKGLFGKDNPISQKIKQYTLGGEFIKEWDSAMDVKRELGFSNSNISSCCSGNLKSSSGFIWRKSI